MLAAYGLHGYRLHEIAARPECRYATVSRRLRALGGGSRRRAAGRR